MRFFYIKFLWFHSRDHDRINHINAIQMQRIWANATNAWTSRILIRCKHHGLSVVTYLPRNPFISRRRSLDVVETIRYTWNQLARSAGKWVKGLTVLKRQRERGREKDRERRTQSRCSLRNDSTIAWSIFFSLFLFLSRASLSFPLFAFPLFACIFASICKFVFYVSLLSFLCLLLCLSVRL